MGGSGSSQNGAARYLNYDIDVKEAIENIESSGRLKKLDATNLRRLNMLKKLKQDTIKKEDLEKLFRKDEDALKRQQIASVAGSFFSSSSKKTREEKDLLADTFEEMIRTCKLRPADCALDDNGRASLQEIIRSWKTSLLQARMGRGFKATKQGMVLRREAVRMVEALEEVQMRYPKFPRVTKDELRNLLRKNFEEEKARDTYCDLKVKRYNEAMDASKTLPGGDSFSHKKAMEITSLFKSAKNCCETKKGKWSGKLNSNAAAAKCSNK